MKQNKFTERVTKSDNLIIKEKIEYLSNIDYSVEGKINLISAKNSPIFTVILIVYNGSLEYIEDSITSVLDQTYQKVELILIDHGSRLEAKKLLHKLIKGRNNVLLLNFKENTLKENDFYSLDSPISKVWDAGLFASNGDFVYFLADDDKLSNNYVEKMVSLFINNKNCYSASPRVVSINQDSEINTIMTKSLDLRNTRGKYVNGISLAESLMNKGKLVSAPGGLLSLKSDLIISNGGFDFLHDITQFFRFGIYGDSGYDDSATLFWRHHNNQTNKKTFKKGIALQYKFVLNSLKPYKINDLHNHICGKNFSFKFEKYLSQLAINGVYTTLKKSLSYSFFSAFRVLKAIFKECPLEIKIKSVLKIPIFFIEIRNMQIRNYLKKIINNLKT